MTTYKLLLKQSIGKPSIPCVEEGAVVNRGSCIAKADGLGANLHASVTGKIIHITPEAIFIEGQKPEGDEFQSIPQGNIYERIQSAGIVGMGGAGFPTWAKLGRNIPGGTVIANAAECEPILSHNIAQIEADPEEIYQGLLDVMQTVNAEHGVIAIKSKHKKAISILKKTIRDHRVSLFALHDLYPMGEERALVRDVLGKLLPPDELPLGANAIVINVETLSRVAQAVEEGRPTISKNVTVAGKLHGRTKSRIFMDVPIGTRVGDLITEAGGIDGKYGEIIMGGPFTGHRVSSDDVITKTTGGLIVTAPFQQESRPLGLLVCACSANEVRMREIAASMGAKIAGVDYCTNAVRVKNGFKCLNPGVCPGQVGRVLSLRKAGAEALLIGNCSDCTNTVMAVAPKMHLPVHHITDGAMQTMNLPLIRKLQPANKTMSVLPKK